MAGEAKIFRLQGKPERAAPEPLCAQQSRKNQFELPMLGFHAACLALFVSGAVGTVAVALA